MTFAAAHQALEERMNSNWTLTEVAYENVTFNRPDPDQEDAEWVEFWVVEGFSENDSVKSKWQRLTGLVQCDFYIRANTGSRRFRTLIDAFEAIFANVTVSGIRLETPDVDNVPSNVPGFVRKTCSINFVRNEAD